MEKEYWQQFTSTGKVEDYLSYRMEQKSGTSGLNKERNNEVGNRESDCTDRNGTVYSSGWRV
ncbi:hypothetical protein DWX43_12770 [Clostridium sp. AF19-22AC]|jgi:hypothetical protein|uniref:Uncharacterized protein n=1 Tax=Faecalicatena orotica TaxID=1544 RepID=A0A2Y9BE19_9FIRM|nr:hypothetical protein [Faecalicatena orotica]PWJ29982.1 hypothetical protein A8806_105285 [Faecalicatena orotica]RHR28070.1 hypothetical protein DWX43_12770 [Clostridium sp. AF19-22AC]SSA55708.1 hypothetical protein SAMN05216536_105285 [Faecalicatena orotica]